MKLNVRCCCRPEKVLGTLSVPDSLLDRDYVVMMRKDGGTASVQLKWFWNALDYYKELAVYSDDTSPEFWDGLVNFEANEGGKGWLARTK